MKENCFRYASSHERDADYFRLGHTSIKGQTWGKPLVRQPLPTKLTETVILLKLTWPTVHFQGCSDLPSFSHERVLHLGGIRHSDPLELCKHWDNTHLGGHQQVSQENCKEHVPLFLLTAIKKHNAPEHMQQYDNQRHESWKDKSAMNSQSCRQQTPKLAEPQSLCTSSEGPLAAVMDLTTMHRTGLIRTPC